MSTNDTSPPPPPVYEAVPAGPPPFSSQPDLSTTPGQASIPSIPPAVINRPSRVTPSINLLFLGSPSVGKSTFISQVSNVRDGKLQHQHQHRHDRPTPAPTPTPTPTPNPSSFGVSLFARPYNITIYRSTSTLFVDPLPPPSHTDPTVPAISLLVLCYAIDDRASLFNVQKYWHRVFVEKYVAEYGVEVPTLLLGLKRDRRTGERRAKPGALGDRVPGPDHQNTTRAFEQQVGWREALAADRAGGRASGGGGGGGGGWLSGTDGGTGDVEEEEFVCVMPEEAVRVANEMRCDRYAECSAVTGDLMFEALEDITKMAAMTTTEKGGFSDGPGCALM